MYFAVLRAMVATQEFTELRHGIPDSSIQVMLELGIIQPKAGFEIKLAIRVDYITGQFVGINAKNLQGNLLFYYRHLLIEFHSIRQVDSMSGSVLDSVRCY